MGRWEWLFVDVGGLLCKGEDGRRRNEESSESRDILSFLGLGTVPR